MIKALETTMTFVSYGRLFPQCEKGYANSLRTHNIVQHQIIQRPLPNPQASPLAIFLALLLSLSAFLA